jgi:hypothetical protein
MADRTGLALEKPLMKSRLVVAARTFLRRALENIIDMAFFAGHVDMRAGQFESREIVVKSGRFPTTDLVTCAAVLTKLAVVGIILLVTGIAILGCAFKDVIFVTLITAHFGMFAFQLESRKIMIKIGGLPASGFMTGAALFAKLAFVSIVFLMACAAVYGQAFEIGRSLRIEVTLLANNALMFAFQLEGRLAVIKFFTDGFDAIVTSTAVSPIGPGVSRKKSTVNLLVTGAANRPVKMGDILAMTICTCEELAITAPFMRGQRVTGGGMRKITRGHIGQSAIRTLVVAMTGAASQGAVLQHQAMRGGRIGQLRGNISMAAHAAITLRVRIPEGRVTAGAIAANFSMRTDPAQAFPLPGIETAGGKHATSIKKSKT